MREEVVIMKEKNFTLEEKVQRALDYQEIQNVMARHVYYHSMGKHIEELEKIWVKKALDPSFAVNEGKWIGMDVLKKFYGLMSIEERQRDLKLLMKHFSELEYKEENYGAGYLTVHPLTTPLIEIANDGQTAKAVWYSNGAVTGISQVNGLPEAFWCWEKYGADFAREDGVWRLWHLHMYTDFLCPADSIWTKDNSEAAPQPSTDLENSVVPNDSSISYKMYSPKIAPQDVPKMPEPYETFSETIAY